MNTATVTSKGQVTIPKEIRDFLHLAPGDQIDYVIEKNGKVSIHPATIDVMRLKGMLKKKVTRQVSVEDMNLAIIAGAAGQKS